MPNIAEALSLLDYTMHLLSIFHNFFILRELISHGGWSIFVGIVASVIMVCLLLFIVRGFYRNAIFNASSIVVSIILGVLLCIQFIPMSAAFALKNKLDDFEYWLNSNVIHPENFVSPQEILPEESEEIVDKAVDEYPILGTLVGSGHFEGYTTENLSHGIITALNDYLNNLIIKLLFVAFIEVAICAFILVKQQDKILNHKSSIRVRNRSRNSSPTSRHRLAYRRR